MGVDAIVTFPWRVRARDVADVLGIAAGLTPERYMIQGFPDSVFMCVPGAAVEVSSVPEGPHIFLRGKLVDGETEHFAMFHMEGKEGKCINPGSTPFWIAVSRKAIEFFGGSIVYNDCGDLIPNETYPEQPDIHAEDGDEWDAFQLRKLAVKPVTKKELKDAAKVATYK